MSITNLLQLMLIIVLGGGLIASLAFIFFQVLRLITDIIQDYFE